MKYKFMFYGPAGGGKTSLAVSSFWDFLERKAVGEASGRLLLFGSEGNDALGIPEEMIRRFPYDPKAPLSFFDAFIKYLEALHAAALRGDGPTSVVVDSLSELSDAYVDAFEEEFEEVCKADKWASWRAWRKKYRLVDRLLSPSVLGAHVFCTAHTREVKETVTSTSGKSVKGDSKWLQDLHISNIPAVEGKAKEDSPHNFDFIVYMKPTTRRAESEKGLVEGPVHLSCWMPTKDFLVKNKFEHEWKKKHPAVLENVVFADILQIIEDMEKGE